MGKKLFDPLLILHLCPLTKKLSVYNFNSRFIWTVRDRITTNKSRKMHFKKLWIYLHFNEWNKNLTPFAKYDIVLGGKTLVGYHRGQTFLVVGHQVWTHFRRDFVPLLFADPLQVIKVCLRLMFGNSNLQLPPQIFYGIKIWRLARPLHLNVLLLEPLLCVFWVIVMLEYPSTTHFQCPGWLQCPGPDCTCPRPSSLCCDAVCPVLLAKKHPKA